MGGVEGEGKRERGGERVDWRKGWIEIKQFLDHVSPRGKSDVSMVNQVCVFRKHCHVFGCEQVPLVLLL